MTLKFTILGCSSSTGVPAAGNYWGACDPAEPKNHRSRPSLLIQSSQTTLIIDTGPDLREQVNRANVSTIDAALITHAHSDHVAGIDELRSFAFREKRKIPIYCNNEAYQDLHHRYQYLFESGNEDIYPPVVEYNELDAQYYQSIRVGEIELTPFPQGHGKVTSTGYRFGSTAYSTDMKTLEDSAIKALKGLKTWVVDAAGYNQDHNPVHATLKEIFALNEQIEAERVILTSLSLGMDYQTLINELPKGYEPAYDGLVL